MMITMNIYAYCQFVLESDSVTSIQVQIIDIRIDIRLGCVSININDAVWSSRDETARLSVVHCHFFSVHSLRQRRHHNRHSV